MNHYKLDLDTWNRKEHFEFYRRFEEPFHGICVEIDCTCAYDAAKRNGASFFLYYIHRSLIAANEIKPFCYRIDGDSVDIYEKVHAAPTIGRDDGTFGFGFMEYKDNFEEFEALAKIEIERVRKGSGLMFNEKTGSSNTIHYSALPWTPFTALSHARSFSHPDSNPKISFGKMHSVDARRIMPVSIHVHHALIDGYHVGQYVERFQQLMDR